MQGDVGLAEQDAARGVEPGRQQDRGRVVDPLAQLARVEGDRDRVQVDDAVDRLAAVLAGDVLRDRADVVAEVLAAGRLDAGEDAHRGGERYRSARVTAAGAEPDGAPRPPRRAGAPASSTARRARSPDPPAPRR